MYVRTAVKRISPVLLSYNILIELCLDSYLYSMAADSYVF